MQAEVTKKNDVELSIEKLVKNIDNIKSNINLFSVIVEKSLYKNA